MIAAEDLEVRYQGGPSPAVRGVSLPAGARRGAAGLRGPAGAGKTSLLRGLLGLVAHRGRRAGAGRSARRPAESRGRVGYGPQGEGFATRPAVIEAVRRRRGPAARARPARPGRGRARAGRASAYVAGWRTAPPRRRGLAAPEPGDRRRRRPRARRARRPLGVPRDARARSRPPARAAAPCWWPPRRPGGLAPALGGRLDLAATGWPGERDGHPRRAPGPAARPAPLGRRSALAAGVALAVVAAGVAATHEGLAREDALRRGRRDPPAAGRPGRRASCSAAPRSTATPSPGTSAPSPAPGRRAPQLVGGRRRRARRGRCSSSSPPGAWRSRSAASALGLGLDGPLAVHTLAVGRGPRAGAARLRARPARWSGPWPRAPSGCRSTCWPRPRST